jgi:hypothetical protein
MAALDFPQSPAVNDTYSLGSYTWKWDGYGWQSITSTPVVINSTGPTGPSGVVTTVDPLSYNSLTKNISLKLKPGGGVLGDNSGLSINSTVIPYLSNSNIFTGSTNTFTGNVSVSGAISSSNVDFEIKPLDDLFEDFNNRDTYFLAKSQGFALKDLNPFRLLINLNGIIQTVTLPDYLWLSPLARDNQVFLDSFGYLHFSKLITKGSTFSGRVLAGEVKNTKTGIYPFKAMDIILGD